MRDQATIAGWRAEPVRLRALIALDSGGNQPNEVSVASAPAALGAKLPAMPDWVPGRERLGLPFTGPACSRPRFF